MQTAAARSGADDRPSGEVDLSVLIVAYRNPEMTRACLESVFRETTRVAFEVIVVDNASGDGTAAMVAREFPAVRLVCSGENLGFARGVNLAAGHARGGHLLLLNPDTIVRDRALERLLDFSRRHPTAGIYGGRALRPDGSLEPGSCWGRMTLWSTFCFATGLSVLGRGSRVLDPESLGRWRRDTVRRVDIVSGSLLLVDRTAWERLGGFDERFWLYGEDADLCRRAQALGYAPVITPDATITHALGASSPSIEDLTVRLFRGKRTLISTHWRPYLRPLGAPLLLFGVALRAAMPVRSARRWRAAWSRRSEWRHGYPDANDAARTSRRATGRRTVWMTSSGGGHAELLAQLLPAVRQFDRTWVMPDVHRSQWLREKGEHVLLVPDWYRDRSHRSLLHATLHSVWLAVRHRPRIVVTSGPGLVVPFCLTARALGAKLIFIETPARLSEPSKAGALLGRFSSAVLVQWKSMAQVYPHVIVCAPPMVAHVATEEEPPGLGTFVGVGTHQQGFDRLLAMVDDAVGRGVLPAPVVAQAGHSTYKPRNFQTRSWLRPDAIDKSIRDARYVVCHGGSGLITSAVRVGRRPLVLARQAAHGEHIDDHQVLMVEHLAAQDLVVALSTSISEEDTASAERPLLAAGADEPQLPTVGDAVAHELERLWPSAMGARA